MLEVLIEVELLVEDVEAEIDVEVELVEIEVEILLEVDDVEVVVPALITEATNILEAATTPVVLSISVSI